MRDHRGIPKVLPHQLHTRHKGLHCWLGITDELHLVHVVQGFLISPHLTAESVLLPRGCWQAWRGIAKSVSLRNVATPRRSVILGVGPVWALLFHSPSRHSCCQCYERGHTTQREDRLPCAFFLAYVSSLELLRTALDEWNTKLSLSVANTFAYFSGCFVALPPLGGPQSSGCRSGLRHAVLSLATDTIALETR